MNGTTLRRIWHLLPVVTLLLAARTAGGAAATLYTSTRCVTDIALTPDGAVWVATTGGVLLRTPAGQWRRYTSADGLPGHEARGLIVEPNGVTAVFPSVCATWNGTGWTVTAGARALPRAAAAPHQTCAAIWGDAWVVAAPNGLVARKGQTTQNIPLPPGSGSHVSALVARGKRLLAAMYDDGLYAWNGTGWRAAEPTLPAAAREVTALAARGNELWVGTRREGTWQWDGKRWSQHLQPDEPWDHNAQSFAAFDGALYIGTLEDGLVVRHAGAWERVAPPTLSSLAPRQMVVFQGALYVRHANGKVDRLAGGTWERDVCASLPRKQVNALATDGARLLAAQWGGWSEFDGARWTHHLDLSELQGVQTTAILAAEDSVWIGTQGKGVAQVDGAGRLRWHDVRAGLADDWVTSIAATKGGLWVGTFVGGLALYRNGRWSNVAGTAGENVTAIVPDSDGVVFTTRHGVYRTDASGTTTTRRMETEGQALCATAEGLWVGSRTGLYRLPTPDHNAP